MIVVDSIPLVDGELGDLFNRVGSRHKNDRAYRAPEMVWILSLGSYKNECRAANSAFVTCPNHRSMCLTVLSFF